MEDKTWKVEVWLEEGGSPHTYQHIYQATDTYVKAGFYCIYERDKQRVTKWPIYRIFRVIEEYKDSARRSE